MSVTTRPLVDADRPSWEQLFDAYAGFYNTTIPDGGFDEVWQWIFDPEIRGSGVGRAMIDHVLEFAKGRRLAGVRWLTQEFNYPARKLYDTYAPRTDFILYNVPC